MKLALSENLIKKDEEFEIVKIKLVFNENLIKKDEEFEIVKIKLVFSYFASPSREYDSSENLLFYLSECESENLEISI